MKQLKQHVQEHWKPYLLLLIVWGIFFAPIISGQSVYYLDDLKILYYPIEYAYAQFQNNWQLPHWSPLFGFGQPLLAWAQLGFFTPLHVILRALQVPPLTILQISVVSYFAIGLIGMYHFLRQRSLSTVAAGLGATLFVFNGFSIGHLNHVNFYTGTMLLPWLLLAIDYLITKPTRQRAVIVSSIAACIALSAQPQITLYILIAAAVFGIVTTIFHIRSLSTTSIAKSYGIRLVTMTVVAAGIWALVSSLTILPLQEFLPSTERAGALPIEELFEFSYPPYHAITLVLPYFFGGHDNYWGAKGFQELAGFVGLVPLFLSGLALFSPWIRQKNERITALILIALSLAIGLGKYSPIYTYLVEHHIITSLANPGRFVFFFDLGIVLLAALGVDALKEEVLSIKTRLIRMIGALALPSALLAPFFIQLSVDSRALSEWETLVTSAQPQWLAVITSCAYIVYTIPATRWKSTRGAAPLLAFIVTAGTLLIYSWDYNPRTQSSRLDLTPPLHAQTLAYQTVEQLPARLYARPDLLRDSNKIIIGRTDEIDSAFSVYQQFTPAENGLRCVTIPLVTHPTIRGSALFSLRTSPNGEIVRVAEINAQDVQSQHDVPICFEPLLDSADKTYWFSLTSKTRSGLYAISQSATQGLDNAYFVRKQNPTPEQFAASQKQARIVFTPIFQTKVDLETPLLERHLNVTGEASSGRWIGALSIRWYREFIEKFLANDAETPIDGDGIHAIIRNRDILNAAGITHLAQALPADSTDTMTANGFILTSDTEAGAYQTRTYTNPQAYPKAYIVPQGLWKAADDEIRFAMLQPTFNPRTTALLSGATPIFNLPSNPDAPIGTAHIIRYEPTRVDVETTTAQEAILLLTDSWTPQWQTFIDDQPAPSIKANSVFKAAIVPAGTHTVSFRYHSPATTTAIHATYIGLIMALLLITPYGRIYKLWKFQATNSKNQTITKS